MSPPECSVRKSAPEQPTPDLVDSGPVGHYDFVEPLGCQSAQGAEVPEY
ncbi:hypothetical protein AB0G74_06005 [Streptomyces sp. NPDC020875]